MSKMLLTNNGDYYNNMHKCFTANGFINFQEKIDNGNYLCIYKKLRIDNFNFLKIKEDYIAVTGTMVYRDLFGEEALRLVYQDFEGDVDQLRKNMLGNFAVCIKKNDEINIFVDVVASYDINYYIAPEKHDFIITNTAYHIQTQIQADPNFEYFEHFMRNRLRINGDRTLFKGVNKLLQNQCITINTKTLEIEVKKFAIDYTLQFPNTLDKIADVFSCAFKEVNYSILKNFKKIHISMTGGIDSRTILASSLANDFKPSLFYWRGNTPLTNTKDEDYEICKIFSEKYDLNLVKFEVLQEQQDLVPNESLLKKYFPKFGELGRLALRGESWINIFEEKLDTELILNGSDGENYRTSERYNYNSTGSTLREFLYQVFFNKKDEEFWINNESSKNDIVSIFEQICFDLHLNPNNLSSEEFEKILIVSGQTNWTDMVNFYNLFFYHVHLFDQAPLIDVTMNTPLKDKIDSKLMVKNLLNLKPDIIDVPIFSRCVLMKINKKTFEQKALPYDNFVEKIRVFFKEGAIKDFARKIHRLIKSINNSKGFNEALDGLKLYNDLIDMIESQPIYSKMNLRLKKLQGQKDMLDCRNVYFLLVNLYLLKLSKRQSDKERLVE